MNHEAASLRGGLVTSTPRNLGATCPTECCPKMFKIPRLQLVET